MGVAEGAKLALESRFVGGLPLVNALLDRLTVDRLLATALPSSGRVSPAQALGVLLRNIVLNDRQPIYTHAEWAHRAEPALIGLAEGSAACLNDDRVGRALDRQSKICSGLGANRCVDVSRGPDSLQGLPWRSSPSTSALVAR